jgi:superfamily II DNA or RNA helicase
MLDLKAMQVEVHLTLVSETPESLANWLDNYRIIMNKQQLQDSVPNDYPFTALLWATGSGKTGAAFKVMSEKGGQWVILTNETMNIESLKKEGIARGYENLVNNTKFYCYSSLHKVVENYPDANIVLDEAQSAFTDLRLSHLKKLNPKNVVITTATIDDKKVNKLIKLFKFKDNDCYISRYSLNDNIENGILPDPVINLYKVTLNNTDKSCNYVKSAGGKMNIFNGDISERFNLLKQTKGLKGGYIINLACTEQEYYDIITADIQYYSRQAYITSKQFLHDKARNLGLQRAKFLALVKDKKALDVVNTIKNKRYIAFAYSIDSAKLLSNNTISSKATSKVNEKLLSDFNNGVINNLSAYKMINTGVNLSNIEEAVITHLEKSAINFIQKLGRALRAVSPVIHILYVENTTDEENLNNHIQELHGREINYL